MVVKTRDIELVAAFDETGQPQLNKKGTIWMTGLLMLEQQTSKIISRKIKEYGDVPKFSQATENDIKFVLNLLGYKGTFTLFHSIKMENAAAFQSSIDSYFRGYALKTNTPYSSYPTGTILRLQAVNKITAELLAHVLPSEHREAGLISINAHIKLFIDKFSLKATTKQSFINALNGLNNHKQDGLVPGSSINFSFSNISFRKEQGNPPLLLIDHLCNLISFREIRAYRLPPQLPRHIVEIAYKKFFDSGLIHLRRYTLNDYTFSSVR